MIAFIRRLVRFTAIMIALSSIGGVQRWLNGRQLIHPDAVDPMGMRKRLSEQVKQFQAQKAQLDDSLRQLPPESRAIIQDAIKDVADVQAQLPVNPLIARFSQEEAAKQEAASEDEDSRRAAAEEKAQRMQALWNRTESVLICALWTAAGVVAGLGLLGVFLKERFLTAAASFAMPAARYWLLGLSFVYAIVFSMTRLNPWFEMRAAFYLAPSAMIGSVLFLSLGGAAVESLAMDALSAAAAPVASFVAVTALEVLGKFF